MANHELEIPKPSDIDTSRPFMNTFGRYETEATANALVRFAQHREREFCEIWPSFTEENLQAYRENRQWIPAIRPLVERGVITETHGRYAFTLLFIAICYQKSPAS